MEPKLNKDYFKIVDSNCIYFSWVRKNLRADISLIDNEAYIDLHIGYRETVSYMEDITEGYDIPKTLKRIIKFFKLKKLGNN
jgi:acyl-ACP thioesterase